MERKIKPYYYIRNRVLHCRYTVDKAMLLREDEEKEIKEAIEKGNKQEILCNYWTEFAHMKARKIHDDGIALAEQRMEVLRKTYNQGGKR